MIIMRTLGNAYILYASDTYMIAVIVIHSLPTD